MKALNQTPRFIRGSALMLGACVAAALLCVNTASAQLCPYNVAPGETLDLAQASTGSATSQSFSHGAGIGGQAGFYDPSVNQVGAFAEVSAGLAGAKASAYGQINFLFCVRGNPNGHVNATISANVNWVGVLYGASVGPLTTVTGTLSLVDMGTDGSQSNIIASSQPLNVNLVNAVGGIQVSLGSSFGANFGYSFVTGSAPTPMTARVTVGHVYAIQYNLDCESPSGFIGVASACNFAPSQQFPAFTKPIGLPTGNYNSSVDSLQVTLDQDLYGALIAIKSEVDGLQAQVAANRQAIAAANLTAEQENAQLLGILNEIKALLSALQSDPPISSTPAKAKTSDPKPPIRPVRPRTMDPP